ncbi:MAG: Na+/H+ antiporter NhaA [Bacteroidetes bacterium]|nr:Na+/H+ antiporter NhaA [Bacteroidota bacterium]
MPLHYLKRNFISPLLEFIHDSRAIGVCILFCTTLSLVISNTSAGQTYIHFWETEFHLPNFLPHSLLHWINDGLMTLFFLLAGMEIKREILQGELSSFKKAIMPALAAVGGMAVPAFIFVLFNLDKPTAGGWGIPMATDIAFSLGIASLLGKQVPLALKIFLTALAIIDDLGAILAIAVFYSSEIQFEYLAGALLCLIFLLIRLRMKKKLGIWNLVAGILLWLFLYHSGIHATIAGVLIAFTIAPADLIQLENRLHHPVNFLIIPLFVLANSAIVISDSFWSDLPTPLSIGIIVGLLPGKPLGIFLFCQLGIRLKWGELPAGITNRHLTGLGLLASIGFTMSIFISLLAFPSFDYQNISKTAVMVAALLGILLSVMWFKVVVGRSR